jgi:hypothetical protein
MLFCLHNGRVYIIHILSRARAYAFRVGAPTLLTLDHKLAVMLFRLHNGHAYVIYIRSQALGYAV